MLTYLKRTEQFPPCCIRKGGLEVSACSHWSCRSQQGRYASAPSPSRYGLTWTLIYIYIYIRIINTQFNRKSTVHLNKDILKKCETSEFKHPWSNAQRLLTFNVSVSHVFTIFGKGILEILRCFQLNKRFAAGTAFFRVGETHSVDFAYDVTVCI